MPRTYSHGACFSCKRRKKKCNEAKPSCSACARLGFDCDYDREPFQKASNGSQLATTSVDRFLKTSPVTSEEENTIFARVYQSILSFYTPATSAETRDLTVMWQMCYSDGLVRNSVLACFSAVLGSTPQHGQLNRRAYSAALKLLHSRIASTELSSGDQLVLRVSVQFLGLLDCVGPEQGQNEDPTRHWRALAMLLVCFGSDIHRDPSPLHHNLNMQVLESFTYNISSLALFSSDVEGICKIWGQTRIVERLEEINPDGPTRILNSPLLSGEYWMYDMVLKVTLLHRLAATTAPRPETIDTLLASVYKLDAAAQDRFLRTKFVGTSAPVQHAMRETVRMLADALLICLMALREPSEMVGVDIDRILSRNLHKLCEQRTDQMCLGVTMWPVQIFACAIRDEESFEQLLNYLDGLKVYLDPGHCQRLEAVIEKVQQSRREDSAGSKHKPPSLLPLGLLLLRKPNGILS